MEIKLSPGQFFGDLLRAQEAAGLILTEYTYSPDLKLPTHQHDYPYFCVVVRGAYTEVYGHRTRTCKPLTVTYHPAGEKHSDHFHQAGGRIFSIEIQPVWLNRVYELSKIIDHSAYYQGGTLASLAIKLYKEFHEMDGVSPLVIEGLLLEIVAEASRQYTNTLSGQPPLWLIKARELIQSKFTEQMSLSSIAKEIGVHPVHLARGFRKHYRCTLGEYVRRLRVEFACHQLSTCHTPLIDIALSAGFSHQSHFSRTFKKIMGITPAEYRTVSCSR